MYLGKTQISLSQDRFRRFGALPTLWILLFLNNAGAWTSWLVLGPYVVANQTQLLIGFGLIALVRQLFGFGGTLLAASWANRFGVQTFNLNLEKSMIALNCVGLLCVWYLPSHTTLLWAGLWSLARFFMAGISTVTGYALIYDLGKRDQGDDVGSHASNSLVSQLAVGQGSVILGSLLGFSIAGFSPRVGMSLALIVDMLTSLVFAAWLSRLSLSRSHHGDAPSPIANMRIALKALFTDLPSRYTFAFLFSLLSLTSLPTIFMYLSKTFSGGETAYFYSGMNFVNGLFLLIAAYNINKSTDSFWKDTPMFLISSAVMIVSCGLIYFLEPSGSKIFLLSGLLSFGSTAALLCAHKLTVSFSNSHNAVVLRSSMALYLNLIFGISEFVCAALADEGAFRFWIVVKAASALIALGLIFFPERRGSQNA